MFFPEKIKSIGPHDKVLEIGPGANPHPRSDAFLELDFASGQDRIAQRGGGQKEADFGAKPIYRYSGDVFPFADQAFDYVICSHVIEHVPDPEAFMAEVFRVGSGRGYLEYPLVTYEYIYNFDVHLQLIKYDAQRNILLYCPKKDTSLAKFAAVHAVFHKTLESGWDDLCVANREVFFQGFEFQDYFLVKKIRALQDLTPSVSLIKKKKLIRKIFSRFFDILGL
ncbi:MAG: methyltransferase domain-containing protein [Ilumatobacteraceae bacterium]|nr:methyltransferase domain-containing protein [Ilumatobacteraceae bacterium]